jgi:hypothetical protein
MVIQLVRAARVELISGRTLEVLALAFDVERIARGGVGGEEFPRPLPRDVELAELGQDDGPTEKR